MPVISRSSGPSTFTPESSSIRCFKSIGISEISPRFRRRQWGGDRRLLRHTLGTGGNQVRGRQLGRHIWAYAEIGRGALRDGFENRSGCLTAVIGLGVRFVEKHTD